MTMGVNAAKMTREQLAARVVELEDALTGVYAVVECLHDIQQAPNDGTFELARFAYVRAMGEDDERLTFVS
jgi:hypothetical protein